MPTSRRLVLVALLLLAALGGGLLLFDWRTGEDGNPDPAVAPATDTAGELGAHAKAGELAAEPAADGATTRAAAAGQGCILRGRVIRAAGGQPEAGVEVRALDRHPAFADVEVRLRDFLEGGLWKPREIPQARVLAATLSGPDGRFELTGLEPGRVFLDARSSSFYSRANPALRLVRAEAVEGVELLLTPGGRVKGQVLDADNKPIEAARVVLRPGASAILAQITNGSFRWLETVSDKDGHFDFAGVPKGEGYAVAAITSRAALAQSRELAVREGVATEVILRGTRGATIEGRVVLPDGKPAANAWVAFAYLDLARMLFSVGPDNPVHADAEGRFQIQRVAGGDVVVSAMATDWAFAVPRTLPVVDGGRQSVELVLTEGHAVRGRVIDALGQPVKGAMVSGRPMDEPRGFDLSLVATLLRHEAETDAEGRFELRGLVSERVFLEANKDGYLPARHLLRRDRGEQEVELTLRSGGWIAGRVVDEAGQPVSRFRVRGRAASDRRMPIGPDWGQPPRDGNPYTDRSPWLRGGEFEIADADGRFRVGPFAPGDVRLSVDAPGFVPADERRVEVKEAAQSESIELKLTRGATLRGKVVVGTGGPPVSEAQVTWRPARERRDSFLPFQVNAEPEDLDFMRLDSTFGSRSVLTDARGEFELTGVVPGKVNLTARHPDYAKVSQRDLAVAATPPVEGLVLELTAGGAIEGRVVGLDGKTVPGATIGAFSFASGSLKSAVSDANGTYRIEALPPGSYVVFKVTLDVTISQMLTGMLGSLRLKSATVREGKTCRVDIEDRSEGGCDVWGTVTADGKPLPKAVITLLGQDRGGPFGVGLRTATADDQGRYEIASVLPGRYLAQITQTTGRRPEQASESLVVPSGQTRVRVDLRFPTGEIAGIVVDTSGKPVRGVRLRAVNEGGAQMPGGLIGLISEFGGAAQSRSGDDGTFTLRRLAPGTWKVVAEPRRGEDAGFGTGEVAGLQVMAGQKLGGVRLELQTACELEGLVSDGSGQPVSGAAVRVVPVKVDSGEAVAVSEASLRDGQSARALAQQFRNTTRSGADGRFKLRGVRAGTWNVVAEKPGLAASQQTVTLQTSVPGRVDLRMVRTGRVLLRVLDLQGAKLAQGQVRVLNSRGESVGQTKSLLGVMASLFRQRDESGESSEWLDMGELLPDTYTLEVTQEVGGQKELRSTTRSLGEGEQARWEVRLGDMVRK